MRYTLLQMYRGQNTHTTHAYTHTYTLTHVYAYISIKRIASKNEMFLFRRRMVNTTVHLSIFYIIRGRSPDGWCVMQGSERSCVCSTRIKVMKNYLIFRRNLSRSNKHAFNGIWHSIPFGMKQPYPLQIPASHQTAAGRPE